jgi:hypothetical protein
MMSKNWLSEMIDVTACRNIHHFPSKINASILRPCDKKGVAKDALSLMSHIFYFLITQQK